MIQTPRYSQDGLRWSRQLWNTVPHWTRQPSVSSIENVCRQQLKIQPKDPCQISFYAVGAFNRLYRVECLAQTFIMRVTLPVYPYHKTHGEVTTLNWLRHKTTIPVPKIIAFDDSRSNEIGFEWILIEFMPGCQARRKWRTMTKEQKVALTERIAEIQAELFRCGSENDKFKNIGTLHWNHGNIDGEASTAPVPGELVCHEFFLDNRLQFDFPRGPFQSSGAWLESIIKVIILEKTAIIEEAKDDDDVEDEQDILIPTQRLLSILPKYFPPAEEGYAEPTVLYHPDLNLRNILVDDEGKITAIVDWECVSALPIWMTLNVPHFLEEDDRLEEPVREDYGDETPSEAAAAADTGDPDRLDNEGKNPLYWEHLMEYEATQLRDVYRTKLKQLWPEWPMRGDYDFRHPGIGNMLISAGP
ncbi:kinase-like protein [Nemania sp. NC0429]|nr:kinase-like protein [Nemania sp. NC0429]